MIQVKYEAIDQENNSVIESKIDYIETNASAKALTRAIGGPLFSAMKLVEQETGEPVPPMVLWEVIGGLAVAVAAMGSGHHSAVVGAEFGVLKLQVTATNELEH